MSEDKAMSEQKMCRDEMVVGSYVCPVEGDNPQGEVVAVEIDKRGPEYDLLHVKTTPWGQPQRCQRVVMMLAERPGAEPAPRVEQGAVVQWRHDEMPDGVWRRGVAESWDAPHDWWWVRDAAGFLVMVEAFDKNILPAKDGLPITAEDQIAALRLEVAALKEGLKERQGIIEDLREELRDDHERVILNREAADAQTRRLQEECDALRAKLVAAEESAAVRLKVQHQAAQVARDRAYEIERQKHEIAHVESREREALAQAEAQRERADMWQAAAQDALDQLAHWRKVAREQTKLCDVTVGIDFRGTDTAARKLAEVAAAVASHDDVRRG